jgi:hypothetical protein
MGKLTFWILLILFLLIATPLATIWSINTLFPVLAIPYTIETWLASFFLFAGVSGVGFSKRK